MTNNLHSICLSTLMLLLANQAAAEEMSCRENKETNAYMCYRPSQLKEARGLRVAPLYMGGPNGVRKTPYTLAADCTNLSLSLKDADGVTFAGAGGFNGSRHSHELRADMCNQSLAVARAPKSKN